jgi:hypothetical protein
VARADTENPDLSIGITGFESIAGSYFIRINLKRPGFNVDPHYLAMIAFLDLLAHLRFINLITTSSELLFAVAGLSNWHRLDLVSTVSLYFNLGDRLCCCGCDRTKK